MLRWGEVRLNPILIYLSPECCWRTSREKMGVDPHHDRRTWEDAKSCSTNVRAPFCGLLESTWWRDWEAVGGHMPDDLLQG